MRKIDNRQYKLVKKPKFVPTKRANIKSKKGRKYDSKLDRRGMK
jgi:hypothetical protein